MPSEPTSGLYIERAWALVKGIAHLSPTVQDIRPWACEAAANLEQALALSPDDPDALCARGELSLVMGDAAGAAGVDPMVHYDRAAADFEAARECRGDLLNDDLGRIEARRGDALKLRGQNPVPAYRNAVRFFERSARRSPDLVSAQVHLGQTLLILANALDGNEVRSVRHKARDCFDQALAHEPTCVVALLGRAEAIRGMAEGLSESAALPLLERAVADLQRAHCFSPQSADVSMELARSRVLLVLAMEDLAPERPRRLASIAQAALDDFDRTLKLEANCTEARRLRAIFQLHLYYLGEPVLCFPRESLLSLALGDLDHVIRSGRVADDAFYWRAMARQSRAEGRDGRERLNGLLAAETDVEEAIRRSPDRRSARVLRAAILLARAGAEFALGFSSVDTCRRVLETHRERAADKLSPEDESVLSEVRRRLQAGT